MNQIINRLHNPNLGVLFLRLALGVVFVHAGWLKLINMEFILQGFAAMGIPAWLTYLVAYSELVGGLLLIFGFLVRYVGVVLAIIMITAIAKVHWLNGFGLANNGYEYVFVLLLSSLALITLGSGSYSLTRYFKKRQETA